MQELVLALAEVSSCSRGAQYHANTTFSRRYEHHPPTKLHTPVVADDGSVRREGEPPLVPDHVAPAVEGLNVDDDLEDDDEDPNKYFNTAYDGLMAQDAED